jgi:putative membrane protein
MRSLVFALVVLAAPLALVAVPGCTDDDDIVNTAPNPNALSEGEVAGVVSALNTGEIQQGTLASDRAASSAVRDYAQMMVTEHTAAEQRMTALLGQLGITPQSSTASQQVTNEANTMLQSLQSAADFDRAYVDSQVTMHTRGLQIVDDLLLPNATRPELRTELQTMRSSIAMHLDMARALQSSVGADGGTTDSGTTDGGGDGATGGT